MEPIETWSVIHNLYYQDNKKKKKSTVAFHWWRRQLSGWWHRRKSCFGFKLTKPPAKLVGVECLTGECDASLHFVSWADKTTKVWLLCGKLSGAGSRSLTSCGGHESGAEMGRTAQALCRRRLKIHPLVYALSTLQPKHGIFSHETEKFLPPWASVQLTCRRRQESPASIFCTSFPSKCTFRFLFHLSCFSSPVEIPSSMKQEILLRGKKPKTSCFITNVIKQTSGKHIFTSFTSCKKSGF